MSQAPAKKKHKNKRKRESGGNGILQETPGIIDLGYSGTVSYITPDKVHFSVKKDCITKTCLFKYTENFTMKK